MNQNTMITDRPFGALQNGETVRLFTLVKGSVSVTITNYGGTITSLVTPDRYHEPGDIVLGFEHLADYTSDSYISKRPYFGALIGRYANRIAHGKFTLDGKAYALATNSKTHHIHGGNVGFDKVVWQPQIIEKEGNQALELKYLSKDGEEGFPGNLNVRVVYSLTSDGALRIDYSAETDRATPVALTNHSYFNLSAGKAKDALHHEIAIHADRYLATDDTYIPTGEVCSTKNTPLDFATMKTIGSQIDDLTGTGFAHTYVLNGGPGEMIRAATLYDPLSGRTLELYTTEPALHFYSGNFLDGTLKGKIGEPYVAHYGVALEPHHFPDSPNHPGFPSTILRPGKTFSSTTIYKFSAKK